MISNLKVRLILLSIYRFVVALCISFYNASAVAYAVAQHGPRSGDLGTKNTKPFLVSPAETWRLMAVPKGIVD